MDSNWTDVLPEDPANWWVDRMYLQDAFAAARHSTDPNTQVGAVLVVPAGGVVLSAWNGVPERLRNYPYTPDTKNFCTEHAERAVVFKALQNGLPTEGLTLYGTWAACAECSRTLIQFGIRRVVTLRRLVEATPERWSSSIHHGLGMMAASGIQTVGWSGDLSTKYSIRFNGTTVGNEELR
jgi:deoxycytidylate deaminase